MIAWFVLEEAALCQVVYRCWLSALDEVVRVVWRHRVGLSARMMCLETLEGQAHSGKPILDVRFGVLLLERTDNRQGWHPVQGCIP